MGTKSRYENFKNLGRKMTNLGTKITKIRELKLQKSGNKFFLKKTGNKSYKNLRPKSYKNLGTKMTKNMRTKITKI
jgi:hypothetical protein